MSACRLAAVALGAFLLVNPVFSDDTAPERVIDLDGTSNTRDIGGYRTSDQRIVRWQQVIRSEELSRLSASDFQQLEALGLKTVVDLRTNREREKSPVEWQGESPPRILHLPIGDSHNEWFNAQRKMMKENKFTEEEALEHMEAGYRMIADEGIPSLRELMELVQDESNWPILIHCSAGKDRAGVATALILEAVGVDRDTIMEDYLLSNEVSRAQEKAELLSKDKRKYRSGSKLGRGPTPGAWFQIIGVAPEMLASFYAHVEERYGSMDAFLTELGVEPEERKTLAASLTEPAGLAQDTP